MKNIEQEKKAVEQVICNSIGWAKDKDFDLLHNTIANDEDYLEVHPEDKIIKGFTEFKKSEEFFKSEFFKAVGYKVDDLQITLSQNQDVAWWYCKLDDMNEWKGQSCSWMNVRWTGVLEKRDDRWQIMQMHFSYAEK
jgi:SnoaL-like domain